MNGSQEQRVTLHFCAIAIEKDRRSGPFRDTPVSPQSTEPVVKVNTLLNGTVLLVPLTVTR